MSNLEIKRGYITHIFIKQNSFFSKMGVGDLRYEIVVEGNKSVEVNYGHLEDGLDENGFSVKPSLEELSKGDVKIKIYGKSSGKMVGCIRKFNGRKNSSLIVKSPSDISDDSDEYMDRLKLNKYAKDYEPRPLAQVKSLIKK